MAEDYDTYPTIGGVRSLDTAGKSDPPHRPWLIGGLVIIALMAFLGFGVDPTPPDAADQTADPTLPASQPIRVPDLTGFSITDAPGSVARAGFTSPDALVVHWIANRDRPSGIVVSQDPAAGSEVPPGSHITIEVSAGSPTVGLGELAESVQSMVLTDDRFDPDEPILLRMTAAGPAYKQDALLFGSCGAVEAARPTFLDTAYDEACVVVASTVVTGWLPDGTAFRLEGLPPDEYHPTVASGAIGVDLPDGTTVPLGLTGWTRVTNRAAATEVGLSVDRFTVRSGYWEVATRADPNVLAEVGSSLVDLALETDPREIDLHLTLDLPEPLRFIGAALGPNAVSLDYGPFFVTAGCPDDLRVLCDEQALLSITADGFIDLTGVRITALDVPGAQWQKVTRGVFEAAAPSTWAIAGESLTPGLTSPTEVFSAGTFPLRPGGEMCGHVPENALRDLGPTDVFVSVQIGSVPNRERPSFFDDTNFPPTELLLDARLCSERPDLDIRFESFDLDGTGAWLLVAFGPEADHTSRSQVWAVLDTLHINNR